MPALKQFDIVMRLPRFEALADDEPSLSFSPMARAVTKILDYALVQGAIPLTKAGRFRRSFVEWSIHAMDWPGYGPVELYAVCKVLNEANVDPLVEIHDLMVEMKLARQAAGAFSLTAEGRELTGRTGRLFELIAPYYLYRFDRIRYRRRPVLNVPVDWDVYMNVLNLEADQGARCADLAESLLGVGGVSRGSDEALHDFHEQVLRPLSWLGLIAEVGDRRSIGDRYFAKTPLWRSALQLDTDNFVDRPISH